MRLPYIQWYPSDALTDEDFVLMTMEERGLYITLLSMAWINDGLPIDDDAVCVVSRAKPEEFSRAWPSVSRKFPVSGDRRRNSRQEIERETANGKSELRKKAAEKRWSNANALHVQSKSNANGVHACTALQSNTQIQIQNQIHTPPTPSRGPETHTPDFDASIEAIWHRHPATQRRLSVNLFAQKVLGHLNGCPNAEVIAAQMNDRHGKWLAAQREGFVPSLEKWLNGEEWREEIDYGEGKVF